MTPDRAAAFNAHVSPLDPRIVALRAEHRAIAPASDVGAYMTWLEEQIVGPARHADPGAGGAPGERGAYGIRSGGHVIEIRVIGTPAPQGSKRGFVNRHTGRVAMVESSAKVKPWREAVKWAARETKTRIPGAVSVEMVFTVPKPKSAPKTRRTWPDRKPDVDKLSRSTLDSLVQAGTIEDDARVVSMAAAKRYPNEGPDALDVPGAVIRVREMLDRVGLSAAPAKTESVLNEGICEIAEREREQGIQNIEDCR